MKKNFIVALIIVTTVIAFTSCATQKVTPYMVIPQAVNTINSVGLNELNLKHNTDYTIVNTATAEATVIFTVNKKGEKVTINQTFTPKKFFHRNSGLFTRVRFCKSLIFNICLVSRRNICVL